MLVSRKRNIGNDFKKKYGVRKVLKTSFCPTLLSYRRGSEDQRGERLFPHFIEQTKSSWCQSLLVGSQFCAFVLLCRFISEQELGPPTHAEILGTGAGPNDCGVLICLLEQRLLLGDPLAAGLCLFCEGKLSMVAVTPQTAGSPRLPGNL